jgi:superfamily II DNA/RNA helicase
LIPTLSALFTSAKELQKPRPTPYKSRQYRAEPLVLIIAPTRELCSQIFDECRRVSFYFAYKSLGFFLGVIRSMTNIFFSLVYL